MKDETWDRWKQRVGWKSIDQIVFDLECQIRDLDVAINGGCSTRCGASDIQRMCTRQSVPFMFKQGSAYGSGKDRMLNGQTWDETPFGVVGVEPEVEQDEEREAS